MANLTPEEILRGIIDGTLTSFESDALQSIGGYKMREHNKVQEFIAPNLKEQYGQEVFRGAASLKKVNWPSWNPTNANYTQNTFYWCIGMETAVLPSFTKNLHSYVFRSDSKLEKVDMAISSFSGHQAFDQASLFKTLVLRKSDAVCTLGNLNNFGSSPFASNGTGGTLYCPQNLISQYQSATNWSTILSYPNNQILPIEGSEYEHYYVDGTPIE